MSLRKNYNHRIVKIILPLRMEGTQTIKVRPYVERSLRQLAVQRSYFNLVFLGVVRIRIPGRDPRRQVVPYPVPGEGSCARDPRAA